MHRIEDYQIKLLDKPTSSGFPWLADLETVHGFRYQDREYGQYGTKCTFSLESGDPWATRLNDGSIHFLWVLRDGETVFSGFQVRRDLGENEGTGEPEYDFEFLPLPMWLAYRGGMPVPPDTELVVEDYADNALKWLVRRTLGSLAPNSPSNSVSRAWTCLSVAADSSESPDWVEFDATGHEMYEYIQRRAVGYGVDWDIQFELDGANIVPVFRTYYPRRGSDRSEGNTDGNREIIFSDAMGSIRQQSYGEDTADMGTIFFTADMSDEIVADAGEITNWLARDVIVNTNAVNAALKTARAERGRKRYYELREFRETLGLRWISHFRTGDLVTYNSTRMGYGPVDDTICGVDAEIDEDGFEQLTILFGDPRPDLMDKLRGGGEGFGDPDHTKPGGGSSRYLWGDTPTNVWPDSLGGIGIEGGTGITVSEDAANHKLTVASVWQRGAGPGENALYPATAGDALAIANDLYVYSDNIGGTQKAGIDSEGGGVHAVGWVQVGNAALPTPTAGIQLTHNVSHPDMALVNDGNTMLALRSETGSIDGYSGASLTLRKSGGDTVFAVDGSDGDTTWAAGAKWTIEGDEYTLPTAYPGTSGMALTSSDAGILSWAAPTPAAHDLLGAQHSDTVAAEVSVGSLVVGTAGGWDELDIGPNGAILISNGTMAVWQAGVTRGSLFYGIEGPTWAELSVGAAGTVLTSDGTDISWAAPAFGGDHGELDGLAEDDHPQYFLLAGETTDAKLYSGADLKLYSDAGTTLKHSVDGATGNTVWANGATLTLHSLVYTPPTSLLEYGFLQISAVDGSAGTLSWSPLIQSAESDPGAQVPIWYDPNEPASDGYWSLSGTVLQPTVDGYSVHIRSEGDLKIYSDAGTTCKFEVDGATGNTVIKGTLDVYGAVTVHGANLKVEST